MASAVCWLRLSARQVRAKTRLIDALACARPEYHFAQRIITRAANAGGEAHKAVSNALFEAQLAMGRYAFHWQAHGLRYAIAASIDQHLAAGRVVVFNGSRKTLPEIARAYPQLLVLVITAPADVSGRKACRARARNRARHCGTFEKGRSAPTQGRNSDYERRNLGRSAGPDRSRNQPRICKTPDKMKLTILCLTKQTQAHPSGAVLPVRGQTTPLLPDAPAGWSRYQAVRSA